MKLMQGIKIKELWKDGKENRNSKYALIADMTTLLVLIFYKSGKVCRLQMQWIVEQHGEVRGTK